MGDTRLPPSKPHFFKPLLPGFNNEFLIPTSFFKYLDGQKCEDALLQSGRGRFWPVKINGRRIEDGWTDFAKDHDLHVGDFLVFRHEGNMVFDVMVFEPSACEREYPPLDNIEVDSMEENESSKPESVKYLNESEETQKKKHNTTRTKSNATSVTFENPYFVATVKPSNKSSRLFIPNYFSRSNGLSSGCCKMILRDQRQRSWPVKLGNKKSDNRIYIGHGWHDFRIANGLNDGDAFVFELIKKGNTPIMKFHRLEGNPMAKQEMSTPKAKASSSALVHPYFCGTIKPSNLERNYQLNIPKDFAMSNGLRNQCYEMILKNRKGGSWLVKLRHQKCGLVRIGCGWKEFAGANGLKAGDKFKLELIRGGKQLIMNFYGLEGNPRAKQEMSTPKAKASSSALVHPYFCDIVKRRSLEKYQLNIPKDFARSNGLRNKCCEMMLKNQKGGSWPVTLRHEKWSGQVYIGRGWSKFAVANGLKEGDKFKMELIKGGKILIMNFYGFVKGCDIGEPSHHPITLAASIQLSTPSWGQPSVRLLV